MPEQLGKPIPSPTLLGQAREKFRVAVKALAEREPIRAYQVNHEERKDDIAKPVRQQRGIRDGIEFVGVAQEKAQALPRQEFNDRFEFTRDKTVYVNKFCIDEDDSGPLFIKVCSYAPRAIKLCLNGQEWAKRQLDKLRIAVAESPAPCAPRAEPAKRKRGWLAWCRRFAGGKTCHLPWPSFLRFQSGHNTLRRLLRHSDQRKSEKSRPENTLYRYGSTFITLHRRRPAPVVPVRLEAVLAPNSFLGPVERPSWSRPSGP